VEEDFETLIRVVFVTKLAELFPVDRRKLSLRVPEREREKSVVRYAECP
jgi:hypothetical protein